METTSSRREKEKLKDETEKNSAMGRAIRRGCNLRRGNYSNRDGGRFKKDGGRAGKDKKAYL